MVMPKPVRWIIYTLLSLAGLLVLFIGILAFVSIPVDLTPYKKLAEPIASKAVGRAVTIDGRVEVTTSLWPAFTMEGLRMANPEGFEGDFAYMEKARIRIGVIPLLLFKAHIDEFAVQGLTLDLREKEDGSSTWYIELSEDDTPSSNTPSPESGSNNFVLSEDSLVIDSIDISDITVNYQDPSMDTPATFIMETWTGQALAGKPFEMAMLGTALDHPFSANIKGESLKKFLDTSKTRMEIGVEIAETKLNLGGMFDFSPDHRALGLQLSVQGEQLDTLNSLIGIQLPTIEDYEVKSTFLLTEHKLEMKDLLLRVKSSKLDGHMTIDNAGSVPVADIQLTAPSIDIQDFLPPDFNDDHNATMIDAQNATNDATPKTQAGHEEIDRLLSPKILDAYEATLDVKVENVTSGQDQLGSGHLRATVKDSVFSLDPVTVNIPGGSFFFALTAEQGAASLRIVVEDFDFGIITRMYKPDTDMGGTVSVNVAVESKTEDLAGLLPNANGYIDFIAHPVNLHAGIVDLWAVNLMAAIIKRNEDDKGSTVNCAVARMTIDDGYLTPDIFAIDTTVMRICGRGRVDFKRELIDLDVRPSAKKAEYFSLATPLAVHGSFDHFKFGIARGGIYGTAINFITSPITATARRLGGKSAMPLDGSDLCSMPIGAKDRPTGPPKGCLPNRQANR